MNRLKLFCLNNSGEVFTTFVDIGSLLSFLDRCRRVDNYSVLAVKGNRSLFIEKIIAPNELLKKLNDFSVTIN